MNIIKYIGIILFSISYIQSNFQTIQQISAHEFAQKNIDTELITCTNNYPFRFKQYPLYQEHTLSRFPNNGTFQDTYILSVPHATATLYEDNCWGVAGLVFLNDYFIKECQIKNISPFWYGKTDLINIHTSQIPITIEGSVAICWHLFPECYGHFILDVLCQLALLEIHNIPYDHLCIPYSHPFMQDLLNLWGIPEDTIIPYLHHLKISADKIILPTAVTQTPKIIPCTNYTMDFLIQYVREKLLTNMLKKNSSLPTDKKIFISRKDSSLRNIPNEDEIFKEFKQRGFKRYELSKLSVYEQILLFHNADEIVSLVGSGSTNIIFSKPGTKYIEIIQTMVDATFFFLADIMNLDYYYIDATTTQDFISGNQTTQGRPISLKTVQDFFIQNPEI